MYDRIKKAVDFAFEKHRGQYRKITKIPYIVHPLGVMEILLKEQVYSKFSDDVIIAGILHDIFEDTNVSLDEIEKIFGIRVRELVEAASEPEHLVKVSKKERINNWKERKIRTIEKLAKLDREAKFLIAADKYHNLKSIFEDLVVFKEEVWKHFVSTKENIEWYYFSCINELSKGDSIKDSFLYRQLVDMFLKIFPLEILFDLRLSDLYVKFFVRDRLIAEGFIKEGAFYPKNKYKEFINNPQGYMEEYYVKILNEKISEVLDYYNRFKTYELEDENYEIKYNN